MLNLIPKQEVIEHYVDQDLQITVDRDPGKWTTGNGLMHSGFFLCLLRGASQLDLSDVARFNAAVMMCQVEPGLYDRDQNRKDASSHDDVNGIVSGSVIGKLHFHEDVLSYGLRHFFLYDNTDQKFNGLKDLWAWRLRFPFAVLWYFLVNRWLRLLLPLMLLYLILTLLGSAPDSRIEDYCKVESLTEVYPSLKRFRNWWVSKSKLEMMTARYFNKPNKPEHPLVKLVRELRKL